TTRSSISRWYDYHSRGRLLGVPLWNFAKLFQGELSCQRSRPAGSCFGTPKEATAMWRWQHGCTRRHEARGWDRRSVPNKGNNYEIDSSLARRRFYLRRNLHGFWCGVGGAAGLGGNRQGGGKRRRGEGLRD